MEVKTLINAPSCFDRIVRINFLKVNHLSKFTVVPLCLLLNRTAVSPPLKPHWTQATPPSFTLQSSTSPVLIFAFWTTWLRTGLLSTGWIAVSCIASIFLSRCYCVLDEHILVITKNLIWKLWRNSKIISLDTCLPSQTTNCPVLQSEQWPGRDHLHSVPVSARG